MLKCNYIANLYNKKIFYCNSPISNKLDFINSLISSQPQQIIYLYNFSDNSFFLAVHNSSDSNFISPIDDPVFLTFLFNFYGKKKSCHQSINSIINNIRKLSNSFHFDFDSFDHHKLYDFLNLFNKQSCKNNHSYINTFINSNYKSFDSVLSKLKNKFNNNNNNYNYNNNNNNNNNNNISLQTGSGFFSSVWSWTKWIIGWYVFPIFMIENFITNNYPGWPSSVLYWVLEIIDFLLTMASSLVAFVPPPFGIILSFILDIVNLVYNILRFDIVGVVVSLLGLIPYAGDVLGIVGGVAKPFLKIFGKKLFKSIGKSFSSSSTKSFSSSLKKTSNLLAPIASDVIKPAIIDTAQQLDSAAKKQFDFSSNTENINTPNYNIPSNAPNYNIPSNAPNYNIPSNDPNYNIPSNAPNYNIPSNAPNYNIPSNVPNYNIPSFNNSNIRNIPNYSPNYPYNN